MGSVPLRNWAAANCILRSIGVLSKPTEKKNASNRCPPCLDDSSYHHIAGGKEIVERESRGDYTEIIEDDQRSSDF